jgi:hypothetical protein
MIYATTPEEIALRRKAFIRKWRLKHRAVADSLEEAGDRLFTFVRLPPSQWRSVRTTNAIERLHEEFKRRINPLCLSEIKSGYIRDAIRRGLDGKEYALPSLRCAIGAHPCPRPSACASHYSSERKIPESGAEVPRLRQ